MTVTINLGPLERLGDTHAVLRSLADQVRADTDDFVPFRTGNLASDTLSMIDMGSKYQIVYGAEYAHYLNSHPEFNFYTGKRKEAGGAWFERSKEQNLSSWEDLVKGELTR